MPITKIIIPATLEIGGGELFSVSEIEHVSDVFTVPLSSGNVYTVAPADDFSFEWDDLPEEGYSTKTLIVIEDATGLTATWPEDTLFPDGNVPSMSGQSIVSVIASDYGVFVSLLASGISEEV